MVLQTNRAAYNQNNGDASCQLCGEEDEVLSHILLEYSDLEETRHPIMQDVFKAIDDNQHRMAITRLELGLLDLIVDFTRLINVYGADMVKQGHIQWLQYQSNSLVYAVHALRYKKLDLFPKPKKKRLKHK